MGGKPKSAACSQLADEYLQRAKGYSVVGTEVFASSEKLFMWVESQRRKGSVRLMLFDPAGKMLPSEEIAARVGQAGVDGIQLLVFAIGPADGWSADERRAANQVISFGAITLPHELARVVAAEQIYRALTILAGHPYHGGH